jgi:hypothetical protein
VFAGITLINVRNGVGDRLMQKQGILSGETSSDSKIEMRNFGNPRISILDESKPIQSRLVGICGSPAWSTGLN